MSTLQNQQHSVHMHPELQSRGRLCSGVVLPSFSLSNIWKQFAQEKWNHLRTFEHVNPLPPAVVSMRLFSCQKQCYYKALLSLCQIKKKQLWFYLQEFSFILWTELLLFESVTSPPTLPVASWSEGWLCARDTRQHQDPEKPLWYCWTLELWC